MYLKILEVAASVFPEGPLRVDVVGVLERVETYDAIHLSEYNAVNQIQCFIPFVERPTRKRPK